MLIVIEKDDGHHICVNHRLVSDMTPNEFTLIPILAVTILGP